MSHQGALGANPIDDVGDAEARHQAEDAADEADEGRFAQEEIADARDVTPQDLEDADLLGPLVDGHHHRVHDADRSDEERYRTDTPEEKLNASCFLLHRFDVFRFALCHETQSSYLLEDGLGIIQRIEAEDDFTIGRKAGLSAVEMESLMRKQLSNNQLKYAMIIFTTIPVLIVYPFFQQYFVKGIMLGSLKG